MKLEFPLHFDRDHFEEIYFQNNHGHYIKSPTVRSSFRIFLIVVIIWGISLIAGLITNNYVFFMLSSVAAGVALLNYFNAVRVLYNWKKKVYQFLEREDAYTHYKLTLSDEAFSLTQDETEHIEKWSVIKSADIHENYITITGNQEYVIPLKSIGKEPFEVLKKTVAKKLK